MAEVLAAVEPPSEGTATMMTITTTKTKVTTTFSGSPSNGRTGTPGPVTRVLRMVLQFAWTAAEATCGTLTLVRHTMNV